MRLAGKVHFELHAAAAELAVLQRRAISGLIFGCGGMAEWSMAVAILPQSCRPTEFKLITDRAIALASAGLTRR